MDKILNIKGFIVEKNVKIPVSLSVFKPAKAEDSDDFYCRIHAPFLFKKDKKIFGIDESQASDLALNFVRDVIGERKIIDSHGDQLSISPETPLKL
jgi:hypothetical protein